MFFFLFLLQNTVKQTAPRENMAQPALIYNTKNYDFITD